MALTCVKCVKEDDKVVAKQHGRVFVDCLVRLDSTAVFNEQ